MLITLIFMYFFTKKKKEKYFLKKLHFKSTKFNLVTFYRSSTFFIVKLQLSKYKLIKNESI